MSEQGKFYFWAWVGIIFWVLVLMGCATAPLKHSAGHEPGGDLWLSQALDCYEDSKDFYLRNGQWAPGKVTAKTQECMINKYGWEEAEVRRNVTMEYIK